MVNLEKDAHNLHETFGKNRMENPALFLCRISFPRRIPFSFEVGSFLVDGPFDNQTISCVGGRQCNSTGFKGLNLADGDRLLVSSAGCGAPETVPGAPGVHGISDIAVRRCRAEAVCALSIGF